MGAKNAAARRPPAQSALQVEKLRLPPSRPGPRSPRCFTTPASRPGGFLWATLPHRGSAPQGSVWARWGQGGTRQRRKLDSVKRQGGATGAGATRGARGGPGGDQVEPGREELNKPALLAAPEPGGGSDRPRSRGRATGCTGPRGGVRLRLRARRLPGPPPDTDWDLRPSQPTFPSLCGWRKVPDEAGGGPGVAQLVCLRAGSTSQLPRAFRYAVLSTWLWGCTSVGTCVCAHVCVNT